MKLWVDGQCFQTSSRNRGIGRYAMELLRAISEGHPEVELHLSLNAQMVPEAIAARRGLSGILPLDQVHLWHGVTTKGEAVEGYTPSRRLSELALVHHVNCIAPDVALSLSPFEGVGDAAVPLLQSKYLKAPAYAIFYDAIPIRFQEQYLNAPILRQVYMRRMDACRDFDDLLCISEFALLEARDLLSMNGGVNISAGVSRNFESLLGGQAQSTKNARRDFLLYVGALDWRKNVELIPKAFSLLPEALKTRLDVLLVGDHPTEMLKPIFDLWRSLGLPATSLRSMGLVSDETLFSLYRSAKAVIQPSLMEGFGLTALEALTCGTPVIAARAGALPEVVGSDRLMFDPHSPQELAGRIENVCTDKSLHASIMQNRAGLAERFSWDKTASIAVASLKSALQSDGNKTVQRTEELRRFIVPGIREYAGSVEIIAQALGFAEPFTVTKPRLFVDASSTIRNQLRSGIQRVVRRICGELEKSDVGEKYDVQIIFCDDESGWYRTRSDLIAAPEKNESNRVKPTNGDVILMLDSSWDLAGIHRGFLNEARMVGAKVVSCMFDTVPLRLPGFCLPVMPPVFRDWLLGALQYSSGFVCISKAVADELHSLLENMNYPHEVEIGHWRLGADFLSSKVSETHHFEADSQQPNFLMVGTLEPRKGQSMVIDAFEKGWQSGLEAHLTIVGKYGWEAQHLATRIRTHPEYRKRLHWLDQVEDDELQRLYATCDALISASYGEGFGLPIVEAGQLGVPVIASDIPVFREVAAAAQKAVFFETGSPESLLKTIRKFIRTPPKAKSGAPASWPSWSQSADELLDVVIGGKTGRYQPAADQPFLLPTELGTVCMRGPLEARDQGCRLSLVSGPELIDEDGSQKILVGVTNLSPRPWFGRGDDAGNYGVAISYHVRAADGSMLQYDNPRSNIVLALQPGDTHIISVVIPGIWRERGAASVEIELVQEGVSWWGNPLCVSLLPLTAAPVFSGPVASAAHRDVS